MEPKDTAKGMEPVQTRLIDYLLYLRPASFPFTFLLAFTGYAIGPSKPERISLVAVDLLLLFLIYSVLLWGGTNAFNSGQDKDSGRVNLLPNPPPLPNHLCSWGMLLMMVSILVGFLVSIWTGVLCLTATFFSVYYSWKRSPGGRGKDIPGIDMLINAGGCGLGSVLFGYSFASSTILSWEVVWVGIGYSIALLGGLPTSQIFQLDEEERNYTSIIGPARVLRLGTVLFLVHIIFMTLIFPPAGSTVALAFWIAWLVSVLIGAAHSWNWSAFPRKNSYRRMLVQINVMTFSQFSWSVFAWISK